jgi:hypothetical protein
MAAQPKAETPQQYIEGLEEPRKSDVARLHAIITETVPELEPCMAGSMIGYGKFHYRYASGREGDACRIALSSNKNYISIYALAADEEGYVAERYRDRLPKASIGKSCVRFKRVSDLDEATLRDLLRETAAGNYGI